MLSHALDTMLRWWVRGVPGDENPNTTCHDKEREVHILLWFFYFSSSIVSAVHISDMRAPEFCWYDGK